MEPNLKNHVELVELLGIADLKKGANVAGEGGFYLKGVGALLNQALINFGFAFLGKRKYPVLQTPSLMRNDMMGKCAQQAQFHEELYKVTGREEDKYLIATAEQPLCAYHEDDWINPAQLPMRYAGYSTCFRKEAGLHGQDTLGIFRTHQFEKVEQFSMTSPNDTDSWEMHEEMIKNSEDFYRELNLPHRVVSVVSGALNDAAAKKYDLEAHFPASNTYRELVSCSNCTDYQSRRFGIRFGQRKSNEQVKQYCHMLNSTLTATERTICCILENYLKEDGVEIPTALQPYMPGGLTFIPFQKRAATIPVETPVSYVFIIDESDQLCKRDKLQLTVDEDNKVLCISALDIYYNVLYRVRFKLPRDADADAITAASSSGSLIVTVKKKIKQPEVNGARIISVTTV